jgi:hypothetical protein
MLNRDEMAQLLLIHSSAYKLLMWLAEESASDHELLSPDAVVLLREPDTAARWFETNRERVPAELLPSEPGGPFANLFCSFFSTSFRIRHLELDNRLLDSRLTLGVGEKTPGDAGFERSQALALKHLAACAKMPITEREAHRILKSQALREASLIWTYVWELDRRAKNKGKGPVAHRIWRSIPRQKKRSLEVDQVWAAREQLLNAVRELCEGADGPNTSRGS